MDTLILIGSIILMVIFFGLCIIVHEFGHFLAAKLCGLHIEAFSVGFKKIWGKKINGVDYRIGCIPCGGYVDLPQIDATTDEIRDSEGNILPHAAPWKRIVTAFAGPLFNVLFAFFLGIFIWIFGMPMPDTDQFSDFVVRYVPENCPEYEAGLREGDRIVTLNGHTFNMSWNGFVQNIMLNDDNVKQISLGIVRNGESHEIVYTPKVNDLLVPGEKITAPFFQPEMRVFLYPHPGSAAKKAGILPEDRVLSVNGEPVYSSEEFLSQVFFSDGKPLVLSLERAGEKMEVTVTPDLNKSVEPRTQAGIYLTMDGPNCEVQEVIPGMPADGVLKPGDVIVAFNGQKLKDSTTVFSDLVNENGEKEIKLTVLRPGEAAPVEAVLTPRLVKAYEIGVSFYCIGHPTPWQQFREVINMTKRTIGSLTHSIQSRIGQDTGYTTIGIQHLSGPWGIGRYMIKSFQNSFMRGLYLVVMISFSLGLFNLLPIPVLDGGHILLALIEMSIRRPIPVKLVQPVTYFFMFVLISFMVVVTFFDVKKTIPRGWVKFLEGEVQVLRASDEAEPGSEAVESGEESAIKTGAEASDAAAE